MAVFFTFSVTGSPWLICSVTIKIYDSAEQGKLQQPLQHLPDHVMVIQAVGNWLPVMTVALSYSQLITICDLHC